MASDRANALKSKGSRWTRALDLRPSSLPSLHPSGGGAKTGPATGQSSRIGGQLFGTVGSGRLRRPGTTKVDIWQLSEWVSSLGADMHTRKPDSEQFCRRTRRGHRAGARRRRSCQPVADRARSVSRCHPQIGSGGGGRLTSTWIWRQFSFRALAGRAGGQ